MNLPSEFNTQLFTPNKLPKIFFSISGGISKISSKALNNMRCKPPPRPPPQGEEFFPYNSAALASNAPTMRFTTSLKNMLASA